ncbi:MAG: LysR family transcriptional regulator [Lachnospiraceae bacterium]|nr:LysR family transcriptional regulator [Lachnospiraceae bacterium]
MNLSEIETFLTIVNTKSITRTADLLFLSQPTVSHRLNSLEQELGFPLVIRKKGHKQVELTAKGSDFITYAERWMSLWKETQAFQLNQEQLLLTIGCTDSLNVALLAPFYQQLLATQPGIDLNIQTHHSSELYNILNNHDIDMGFVYHHLHYKNIISERLYEEKLYLVQSDTPAVEKPLVHTDELDPSMELFLSWDDNFQIWHDRWLASSGRPHLSIDTITLMYRLWDDPGYWVIAPESAILELSRFRRVYVSELVNCPPNRACYKIKHKFPKLSSEQAVSVFEQQLTEFLKNRQTDIPVGQVFGGYSPRQEIS